MPGNANMVTVWEKDPYSGRMRQAAKPDVRKPPLRFYFLPPEPPISSDTKSSDFRYWVAAEALRRGADFWIPCLDPPPAWAPGDTLQVRPDRGLGLQSDYDRHALNFYHGKSPAFPDTVYAGASPDLLCHELGHAILDALRPDLWPLGMIEVDAFKESFGDMSAILCALQVSEFRDTLVMEIAGDFWVSSSLSRVAQQFGIALHAVEPDAAEANCLRDAWNDHKYEDPAGLVAAHGADVLAVRPHLFSRIFTGAFYEAFARILEAKAVDRANPTSTELQTASLHMRYIVAAGVLAANRQANFFAQVAMGMVNASVARDVAYPGIIEDVFIRRNILPAPIV